MEHEHASTAQQSPFTGLPTTSRSLPPGAAYAPSLSSQRDQRTASPIRSFSPATLRDEDAASSSTQRVGDTPAQRTVTANQEDGQNKRLNHAIPLSTSRTSSPARQSAARHSTPATLPLNASIETRSDSVAPASAEQTESRTPTVSSRTHSASQQPVTQISGVVTAASASRVDTDASVDGDYALPLQFSPIPSQMNAQTHEATSLARPPSAILPGEPATRTPTNDAQPGTSTSGPLSLRTANLPQFNAASSFSSADRGPYPPVNRPSSVPFSDPAAGYVVSPTGSFSTKGKQKEVETPRVDEVRVSSARSQRPMIEIATNLPSAMGVGRSPMIRNSYSPSSPKQQLLGTTPRSPTGPSPATSQAAQGQYGTPQPAFTSPRTHAPGGHLPPHLIPQPEVCVECMMRDRDMADVDVVGEGIWERKSDAEFEEAMRMDALLPEAEGTTSGDHYRGGGGSEESGSGAHGSLRVHRRSRDDMSGSRESGGGRSSAYGGVPRKRLGRGQPLTTASLTLWTSMVSRRKAILSKNRMLTISNAGQQNPPASAHRWRTLQGYLATQAHLVEMERHAREATAAEKERAASARAADARQSATALLSHGSGRQRSSTILSNGLVVENINIGRDEKQARARAKSKSKVPQDDQRHSILSLQQYSSIPLQYSDDEGVPGVQAYSHGDQPWLSSSQRRASSPVSREPNGAPIPSSSTSSVRGLKFGKFARSSTDLRSIDSPRSVSPARTSLGVDERRGSVWSKFRQSASQSVLSFSPSFAPSGSMMDMHLGLSQDHHRSGYGAPYESYPSMSDPAVARHVEQDRDRALAAGETSRLAAAKPKKRGIKGFFNKLVGGASSDKKRQSGTLAMQGSSPAALDPNDDYDLAPPPPLSALANEPRYHGRSPSSSSVDSFSGPYTPPQSQFRLSSNGAGPSDYSLPPADRGSMMTMGSFTSSRSRSAARLSSVPPVAHPGPAIRQASADSLDPVTANLVAPRTVSLDSYSVHDRAGEAEVLYETATTPATAVPSPTTLHHAHHQPRTQKSLPSLPSEQQQQQMFAVGNGNESGDPSIAYPFLASPPPSSQLSTHPYMNRQGARSAVSMRSGVSGIDDVSDWGDDGLGGGRKSKARSKVFSMHLKGFGSLGRRKAGAGPTGDSGLDDSDRDTAVRVTALNGITRDDGLVSVHY